MTGWSDLLATALVGTDRRPLPERPDTGTDPATAVLEEAAAWAVYRRAGRPPITTLPAPVPAPAETRTAVIPVAAARLAALLEPYSTVDSMTRAALVPEWLAAAARGNHLVPPELLPELLDLGRRDVSLRPLIVAAGGARLGWLAAQQADWRYLTAQAEASSVADADLDESLWLEGSPGQRAGYLQALRRRDADAARNLLAGEWPALAPDERQRLIAVLRLGLGPADEAFLEAALDDRRREVRAAALELLAALPDSAYNARCLARARTALTVTGDGVEVSAPTECDRAMRRDGIEPRPPSGLGARAWWLEQVLARSPLDGLVEVTPAEFLERSIVDDWAPVVLGGLAQAAAARAEPAWAMALLDRVEARLRAEGRRWFTVLEGLYAALPPDDLVRRIAAVLDRPDPDASRILDWLLQQVPAPWPEPLSGPMLGWLERAARSQKLWPSLEGLARLSALRLPVAYADPTERLAERLRAEEPDNPRLYVFDRLAATLRLRHEMIEELA